MVTAFLSARVAAFGDVIVQLLGIDDPDIVQQHHLVRALLIGAVVVGAVGQVPVIGGLAIPVVAQDLLDFVGGEVPHHHAVDLHGRGHLADPQAGCFFQGEQAVRGGLPHLDAQFALQGLEHVAGAADVAGRGLAHPDDVFALGLPGVHGVETHHPEDFAPLDVQARGDALLHFRGEIAHRLLHLLQDGHQGPRLRPVLVNDGVNLLPIFWS